MIWLLESQGEILCDDIFSVRIDIRIQYGGMISLITTHTQVE